MKNPFQYGAKVTGGAFYDRTEIKASMKNALDGCNNVVLYGPRRYGKSSLVAEMIEELRAEGTVCVYLNMMTVASLADFILTYSKVVYRELAPVAAALKDLSGFFKRIRPVIGIGTDGKPELTFSFDSGKLGLAELREALELPNKLRHEGQSLIVIIDEFQEVAELGLGMNFEKIMRSVIESHSQIGYVFLGSKTHMLRRMFAAPSRPFYRSAQSFSLNLPPADESRDFLIRRFASVGKTLQPALAEEMVALSGNVPYYLQALGSWTFRVVQEEDAQEVGKEAIQLGFEQMCSAERDLFENVFRSLPEAQRLVARAIASEPTERFTEDYRIRHFLPSLATANTAMRRLMQDSRADRVEGTYRLIDPLFAHFLVTLPV